MSYDNRSFYNADADSYDKRWTTEGGAHTDQVQRSIIREMCGGWYDKTVIEIGSGTGRFSVELARLGTRLLLIDLSSEMLELAAARVLNEGYGESLYGYQNASIYDLPIQDQSVDCVISINVLGHLRDLPRALHECARVLKEDGELIINYPNLCSYYWPAATMVNHKQIAVGQAVYSQWLEARTVENELESAGLFVEKRIGHVHAPRAVDNLGMPWVDGAISTLDRVSRDSMMTRYAPVHFLLCRKT
jgi:ubiquinone/menaquinone biosynthesis C-methylase UbiE